MSRINLSDLIAPMRKMNQKQREDYVDMILIGAAHGEYQVITRDMCVTLQRELEVIRQEEEARSKHDAEVAAEAAAAMKRQQAETAELLIKQTAALEQTKTLLAESMAREKALREELTQKLAANYQNHEEVEQLQQRLADVMQQNLNLSNIINTLTEALQKTANNKIGIIANCEEQPQKIIPLPRVSTYSFFANHKLREAMIDNDMLKIANAR